MNERARERSIALVNKMHKGTPRFCHTNVWERIPVEIGEGDGPLQAPPGEAR